MECGSKIRNILLFENARYRVFLKGSNIAASFKEHQEFQK